ncbi:hypothetical protein HYDPIDRAFT_29637 [Hydnomerulius pinastri MD-312]|uniref:Uncharacterized protein n=1 Tax=Hydnomerulius pinastri MD-312 TaxID=994086 RepID=A0A0C9VCR2_9AGAM|nr:hypothetical protein HYDPIDRAFT_29637 [Hydnomerulius pinastri MD-312]
MSLYTPVFPSFHGGPSYITQKDSPANTPTPTPRSQNYVEFLRDAHLLLSTQSEVLSPPSRPNSPTFDHRVQKLRETVQEAFDAARGEPASGKWTHVNNLLKMGCVRGRYWSVSKDDQQVLEEDTEWILPDEEEDWFGWEKKREEKRRLKGKAKTSQQLDNTNPLIGPDPRHLDHARTTDLGQSQDPALVKAVSAVSPTTLLEAKEKVKKWQATMVSEASRATARDPTAASTSAGVAKVAAGGTVSGLERSRSLRFPVVKRVVAKVNGKKGKEPPDWPAISRPSQDRGGLVRSPGSPEPPNLPVDLEGPTASPSGKIEIVSSKTPLKASFAADDMPKIADFPETSYLPPSFPSYLGTSTPQPQIEFTAPVRAKPPPIMPLAPSSATPPPSTPSVKSPRDRTPIRGQPHAANMSSSLPFQFDVPQPNKRPRHFSLSPGEAPKDSPVTPPAKKLRTVPQDRSLTVTPPLAPSRSTSISPKVVPSGRSESKDAPPSPEGNRQSLISGAISPRAAALDMLLATSKSHELDTMAQGSSAEKIPSPAKSTKSFFSSRDSDLSNSPISNHNLLLHSPVSPMLSFAQDPNAFLPQYTSTQQGQNSLGRANSGIFGMGYNSQFDVEKHVDRVSELLEKDVDFDGWLRDVPAAEGIEASHDQ